MNIEATALWQTLDFIGSLAFALSGIRLSAGKHFDVFGAYVVGLATAAGGGTMRDVFLGTSPYWMSSPAYLISTAAALLLVWLWSRAVEKAAAGCFLFDTIGLAVFTVSGTAKTLSMGWPWWTAVIMGTMTGAAGGVIRDVLIGEVPLIFRKEIYASACILGSGVYIVMVDISPSSGEWAAIVSGLIVVATRIIAVKKGVSLPILHDADNSHGDSPGKN